MRAPAGRGQLSISGPYLGLASGRARGMAVLSLHHPSSILPFIRSSLSRPARPSPPLRLLPAPAWVPLGPMRPPKRPGCGGCPGAPRGPPSPTCPPGTAASSLRARAAPFPPGPGCGTAVPSPSQSPGPSGAILTSPAGSVLSPIHRPGPFSARKRPLRRFCPHSRLPQAHPPPLPFPCPCDPIPAESSSWASGPPRDPCLSRRALSPRWAGALRGLQLPNQPQRCAPCSFAVLCGYPCSGGFCLVPQSLSGKSRWECIT